MPTPRIHRHRRPRAIGKRGPACSESRWSGTRAEEVREDRTWRGWSWRTEDSSSRQLSTTESPRDRPSCRAATVMVDCAIERACGYGIRLGELPISSATAQAKFSVLMRRRAGGRNKLAIPQVERPERLAVMGENSSRVVAVLKVLVVVKRLMWWRTRLGQNAPREPSDRAATLSLRAPLV